MSKATYKMEAKVIGIVEAVMRAGGQTDLAKVLNVAQPSVSDWVSKGYVPLKRALQIEALYGIDRAKLINPDFLEEN